MTETALLHPPSTLSSKKDKKIWKYVLISLGAALSVAIIIAFVSAKSFIDRLNLAPVTLPTLHDAARGVEFFDRYDHYICTVHSDRDTQPVPLSKISTNMRLALLAAEDHHFYEHHGVDFIGIMRAINKNRKAGRIVEGASTITQQLVRNLYLDKNDRSYKRKIKEVLLSWDVESRYTKAKILETYLNEVYFGDGVYGIERAVNNYFNKHASQLSLGESAFLAGLIKSPSVYANPDNRNLALARQNEVLNSMVDCGSITQSQADSVKSQKLAFSHGRNPLLYPHYINCALLEASRELGDQLWKEHVKVYTNLDQDAQKAAEATLERGIRTAPKGVDQGALVSINVRDGGVLAMVGGVGNYKNNQWNRAVFPHTAGSSFKPFVYLAGLTRGVLEPDTLINDAPFTIDSLRWTPKNYDGQFKGWITVRDALACSRNICAVRVAMETGLEPVIETARAAGITAKLDPYPSLALGACAISPLEMAAAYGALARDGVYMRPRMIRAVQIGNETQRRTLAPIPSSNLPAESVSQLVDVMQDVVRRGTGTQAQLPGIAVAGKTGTADGARDIWFSGFTPDTVTTVWAGSDKNKAVRGHNVTGGSVMAHIWREYMMAYYSKHKPTTLAFAAPTVRLATTIPRYDSTTLLTADVTRDDLSVNGEKVSKPLLAELTSEQISANAPALIFNSTSASQKGIGKAFVVLAGRAAQKWQENEMERQVRAAQGQITQPYVQTYGQSAQIPVLQNQTVMQLGSDSQTQQVAVQPVQRQIQLSSAQPAQQIAVRPVPLPPQVSSVQNQPAPEFARPAQAPLETVVDRKIVSTGEQL